MVDIRDPSVIEQEDATWTLVKFWHTMAGLYFWEFFTTLDYEWRVIRDRNRYRWTIWIYSLARVAGLLGMVVSLIGLDVTTRINCQVWISFAIILTYLSVAPASLLIVLRIIAIWNRNKVITAMTFSLWGINVVSFTQGAVQIRSTWLPAESICSATTTTSDAITFFAFVVTVTALLLIMLFGLIRLRCHGGGTFGVAHLLWKQGVYWLLLSIAFMVLPLVCYFSNVNDQFKVAFQAPAMVTTTIAATRMHRSLVDFASGSLEVGHDSHRASGLVVPKTEHAISIPLNRMELSVDTVFNPHPTLQTSHREAHVNTDEEMQRKPSGSCPDDDVERGVTK